MKMHALISVLLFILFDLYIQLNNINLKLKTVRGDSGCCSKSCCTTECHLHSLQKNKNNNTLYLSQIIVDVHDITL